MEDLWTAEPADGAAHGLLRLQQRARRRRSGQKAFWYSHWGAGHARASCRWKPQGVRCPREGASVAAFIGMIDQESDSQDAAASTSDCLNIKNHVKRKHGDP